MLVEPEWARSGPHPPALEPQDVQHHVHEPGAARARVLFKQAAVEEGGR